MQPLDLVQLIQSIQHDKATYWIVLEDDIVGEASESGICSNDAECALLVCSFDDTSIVCKLLCI